jgi:hypothetical protein
MASLSKESRMPLTHRPTPAAPRRRPPRHE